MQAQVNVGCSRPAPATQSLNNSVYVCLARQLTKAKNPDYAEDFPRQALVKTRKKKNKKAVQQVLFKEQGTTSSIPPVAL